MLVSRTTLLFAGGRAALLKDIRLKTPEISKKQFHDELHRLRLQIRIDAASWPSQASLVLILKS